MKSTECCSQHFLAIDRAMTAAEVGCTWDACEVPCVQRVQRNWSGYPK